MGPEQIRGPLVPQLAPLSQDFLTILGINCCVSETRIVQSTAPRPRLTKVPQAAPVHKIVHPVGVAALDHSLLAHIADLVAAAIDADLEFTGPHCHIVAVAVDVELDAAVDQGEVVAVAHDVDGGDALLEDEVVGVAHQVQSA